MIAQPAMWPPMPQREADQIADGVLRRLRPLLVDFIGAAMTDDQPVDHEESYVADRVMRQLDHYRAREQRPRQRKHCPGSRPKPKAR